MTAPERILVNLDKNDDSCCPVEDYATSPEDWGRYFSRDTSTEYVRADLAQISPAYAFGMLMAAEELSADRDAYVAGLEAAVKAVRHWFVEFNGYSTASLMVEGLDRALSARPAAPDVRVVTPIDKLLDAYLLLLEARSDGVNWDMTQQLEGLLSGIAYANGCDNAAVFKLLSNRRAVIGGGLQ